jgi:mRNA interferase RelE/StbE
MYEVLLHPDAQEIYINADNALAKKIARCFQQRSHRDSPACSGHIKSATLRTAH